MDKWTGGECGLAHTTAAYYSAFGARSTRPSVALRDGQGPPNRSIINVQNLLLCPPESVVESRHRRLRMAQITDRVEQNAIGFDKHIVIGNRQRPDHAGRTALPRAVLAPALVQLLTGFHQHICEGGRREVLAAIE